ncbi:MAG: hypothetical protein ABW124_20185, partial [Candidatus Thiodiazotropha sp. 6PLUC9]
LWRGRAAPYTRGSFYNSAVMPFKFEPSLYLFQTTCHYFAQTWASHFSLSIKKPAMLLRVLDYRDL